MTTFDSTMKNTIKTLAFGVAMLTLMASCDENRNHPGYSYFPDMENSQAYETYTDNPVFGDGKTNQLPPEGTVPREMVPFDFEKTDVNRTWAGQELENPYKGNSQAAQEGQALYNIYCVNCHGDLGDGKGFLFTSGKYPYPPASLLSDKIRNNPDGEIFQVITVGFGVMGAHGAQVVPDQRWKITTYIKEVLHK